MNGWTLGKPPASPGEWFWVHTLYGETIIFVNGPFFLGVGTDQFSPLNENSAILSHKRISPDSPLISDKKRVFTLEEVGYKALMPT